MNSPCVGMTCHSFVVCRSTGTKFGSDGSESRIRGREAPEFARETGSPPPQPVGRATGGSTPRRYHLTALSAA